MAKIIEIGHLLLKLL